MTNEEQDILNELQKKVMILEQHSELDELKIRIRALEQRPIYQVPMVPYAPSPSWPNPIWYGTIPGPTCSY